MSKQKETSLIVDTINDITVTHNFDRVDFKNPITIYTYGDGVKNSIGDILHTSAKLSAHVEEVRIDDETIELVSSFGSFLEESDRINSKKDPKIIAAAKKKIRFIAETLGIKKFEEDDYKNSYEGKFDEYVSILDSVVEAIQSQMVGSQCDVQLRKTIMEETKPYIAYLEEEIAVGEADKEEFAKGIEKLRNNPNQDQETKFEIQLAEQLLASFNDRIDKLKKYVIMTRDELHNLELQQQVDFRNVEEALSFIHDSRPILELQGSSEILSRRAANRTKDLIALNQAVNKAAQAHAQGLEDAIANSVELSLNSGASKETLKILDEKLTSGIELFKKGNAEKQKQIEDNKTFLIELKKHLDSYEREMITFTNTPELADVTLKQIGTSTTSTRTRKRK